MSDGPESAGAALAALRQENDALRREAEGLRRFIGSMKRVVDALDQGYREEDVIALLEQILDNALLAIGADDGSLLVPDEDTGELQFVLARGRSARPALAGARIPAGRGIAGWVLANRRATIVNSAETDDRFYAGIDARLDHRTRSVLAAPLIGGDRVLGVVEVVNRQGGRLFSTGNQTLLSLMCRFAGELLYTLVSDLDLSRTARRVLGAKSTT